MSYTTSFQKIQEEIANMLDVPDEQLSDEQRELMEAYLDELGEQEASKVDGFAGFVRKQTAIMEAIKAESQHLASKARAMQKNIDNMKNYFLSVMQMHGLKKISGEVYSIGVRENTRVDIIDLEALKALDNPVYINTEVIQTPDKLQIKEALKAGRDVPGCTLAKSYSLNIR